MRPYAERIIPDNDRYTLVFDKLEILMALNYAYHKDEKDEWYWAPPGAFGYRGANRTRIMQEIEESLSTKREESPFVTCGIFGETAEACKQDLAGFEGLPSKVGLEAVVRSRIVHRTDVKDAAPHLAGGTGLAGAPRS